MSMDDNDGQMIFGDLGGLKLPDIRLTGEEKPRKKKPHPGNLSRSGIEPGPAAWQARMLLLAPQWWTHAMFYVLLVITKNAAADGTYTVLQLHFLNISGSRYTEAREAQLPSSPCTIRCTIVHCNVLKSAKYSVKRLCFCPCSVAPALPHRKCFACAATPP